MLLSAVLPVGFVFVALVLRGMLDGGTLLAAAFGLACAALLTLAKSDPDRPVPPPEERRPVRSAASAYPDPVVVVDRRGVVAEFNGEAASLIPGLAVRRPLAFALRDPDLLAAVAPVLRSGEGASVEIGGRTAGDPVHEVRLRRIGPADPALGEPAVALYFRDLSGERRLEQMRVDFIANVSHELRTPLATLSGFVETLKGPARDDAAARARFLDIMAAQAGRMTRLVNDLLQLSRTELHEHVRPSGSVDLASEVAQMLEILAPRAADRGARLEADLREGRLVVQGDRDELLRLVENLVENAIRYGGATAPIAVTLRRMSAAPGFPDGAAELVVRDRGPGIAPEHLPRLTERFYRVDVAGSRASGGTGLGLAIVKHIVGRHRGRLGIESVPGEGAAFTVTLPLAASVTSLS